MPPMTLELEQLRREYLKNGLSRANLLEHPIDQFELWMNQAIDAESTDATAMTIATVSTTGKPSQRTVLLKHLDKNGFVFFTNTNSKKAKDIKKNPQISLHFAWLILERQVKIQGIAKKLSTAEVLKYFLTRPRDSQLAAWASPQSNVIASRKMLEQKFAEMKYKFSKGDVPLPSFWGGYRVIPEQMEFWQGRGQRLHDRFEYKQLLDSQNKWIIERLAP